MEKKIPKEIQQYLGRYGECLFDGSSNEPVMWGYPVVAHMGERLWEEIQRYGRIEYTHDVPQKVFLITKCLTPKEAEKKYGKVTNLELGPRGGFRSVTYGEKKFRSKFLDPRKESEEI